MTYDERLARLVEEERGFRAERQGFMDAKTFPDWTKPVVFTRDKKEQQRLLKDWLPFPESPRFLPELL